MIVVDNACEVFELASEDALVWPGEVIAGGDRRVLGIFLQELSLHVVNDGGAEEDAHGGL